MEGWQGIPNAEASQASGVNTEQTMSTDTDQSLGAGVVWHTGTENGAVSDTDPAVSYTHLDVYKRQGGDSVS